MFFQAVLLDLLKRAPNDTLCLNHMESYKEPKIIIITGYPSKLSQFMLDKSRWQSLPRLRFVGAMLSTLGWSNSFKRGAAEKDGEV